MTGFTEHQKETFKEAYYLFGSVQCEECGEIDLSDADDLKEAIEIWNEHVRIQHDD